MANAKRRRKKNNNRTGKICISLILVAFVVVMSIQIIKVYEKDRFYMERQAQLEAQLDDEKQRQQELEEYEAYTGTMQYIIDVAKSKLGLLFKDEIIFREEE
ncbi:MAG: septum formation initiator family protein [Lachnospiraceae bacterium]|nr:septum formation initiator family protein [Lachnospiraceae bacterium]